MEIRKYIGINKNKSNFAEVSAPYDWIVDIKQDQNRKNQVVFFGNDMKGFLFIINKQKYIDRVNECLDFIRRTCTECELIYKPHPADADEANYLNLKGFQIINEKNNGEIYLWKNWSRIKRVFAVSSAATLSAYSMGLDSHVFSNLFESIYGKAFESVKDCFLKMPESFFINDLSADLIDCKVSLGTDKRFENEIKKINGNKKRDFWFVVSASEFVMVLVAISRMLKSITFDTKIHLIIWQHHRWEKIDADFLNQYFDEIIYIPRVYYSVKPKKLWGSLKITSAVKKLKIKRDDIIISGSQVEFLENCIISYFKNNFRIGLLLNRDIWMNYDFSNTVMSNNINFRFSKGSLFYNKIWEPLLGLNKSLYLNYAFGNFFQIVRYQKPVNDIFNQVFVLN
jgi:hypothetical protein